MKKNSIPFLLLAIIHAIILLITFRKKGKSTFTLLAICIGAAYVFEYFVLNLFKMYRYYPKVFKNRWIDTVFGAILSQALFVPIAATSLILSNYGWKARIVVSAIYGGIERLFIKIGVFRNHSWSTRYTVAALPIYFYLVKKWWRGLQNGNVLIHWFSLLLCLWTSYTNVFFLALAKYRKYRFRFHFVKGRYWDHFIVLPLYTLLGGIVGTFTTFHVPNAFKWCGVVIMHVIDRTLYHYKLIKPSSRESLYMLLPIHVIMLSLGAYYKKLMKLEFINNRTSKKLSE